MLPDERRSIDRRATVLLLVALACLACSLVGFWLPYYIDDWPQGVAPRWPMEVAVGFGLTVAPLIVVVVFVSALTDLVGGWRVSSGGRHALLACALVNVVGVWASFFAIMNWFVD